MANKVVKLLAAAGLLASVTAAHADTVTWSLSGVGNGDTGSGTFTETGGVITGVTGTITVDTLGTFTIIGLEASGGYGGNDNGFTGTTTIPAYLTGSGVSFDATNATLGTVAFNLASFNFGPPDYYLLNSAQNPGGYNYPGSVGFGYDGVQFTAAVPETSTWVMMMVGFAAVGFAASRRLKARTSLASA